MSADSSLDRQKVVLHVEDSSSDARLMSVMLRGQGIETFNVTTLRDARESLQRDDFTAILLDLNLPDSSGIETLREMVRLEPDIPIVVITGLDEEELADRALRYGAADYLVKGSFNAGTVTRTLRRSISRHGLQRRFRALVENADGIALVDEGGTVLYVSPAVTPILGWSEDEFVGRNIFDFIHPTDLADARVAFESCIQNGMTTAREIRYQHRDGSWRYLNVTRRNRLSDPAIRGIVVNYHDVTDQRNAREALASVERQYSVLLDSIVSGVLGVDREGVITFVNPAVTRLLGWRPEELIGKRTHETLQNRGPEKVGHDEIECWVAATLNDGVVRRIPEDRVWRKTGDVMTVSYTVAPLNHSSELTSGAVVVFDDITARKELEIQLEQAQRVKSLGRVAATVAHEFNNVMMSIQPFAEVIRRRTATDPSMEKPIAHIFDALKRGKRITDDILRFTQPAEPHVQPLDAAGLVSGLAEEATSILRDRKVTIESSTPLMIEADALRMHQVMMNLIVNARDATPQGGDITIGACPAEQIKWVDDRTSDAGSFAALFVRDSGRGMSSETLERIFEPLFTTKASGGTGIGLAVAHQIVSQHRGRILVDTSPGKGATFYLLLPKYPAGSPEPSEEADATR